MITTVIAKTFTECPECGGECELSHEIKDETGSFVHAYECDECGYSETFIVLDCDVCESWVSEMVKSARFGGVEEVQ